MTAQGQSPDAPDDASIPLLTERLTLPPLELDTTLPLEPHPSPTSAPTEPLSLDTSLPLGLPQAPPPLRPAPAPVKPAAAPASATIPPRPAPVPAAATIPPRTAPVPAAATTPPRPTPVPAAATTPPRPTPVPAAATIPPRTAPVPAAATIPPRSTAAPVPAPASIASARSTTPETSSTHWTRIELELRSSILQAIADALPQQIDSIVRNRMNDAIERLFTQLVAETRLAVAASLRDIVDQAVRAELSRLRRQKP
jgi:hypothetical protein